MSAGVGACRNQTTLSGKLAVKRAVRGADLGHLLVTVSDVVVFDSENLHFSSSIGKHTSRYTDEVLDGK